jgi:gamma-glutamyltranspeptidase/glutathione hydrolase
MKHCLTVLLALALAACATTGAGQSNEDIAPEAASGFAQRTSQHAQRHMAAAATTQAAEAGRWVLRQGGSAADATIAMGIMLTLTEPQSSGIGGGAFLLHYDPKAKAVQAYDGRETAPETATANQFQHADGTPKAFFDAMVGGLSVGVPGQLRLFEQVHRAHGKLPWKTLFEPTIQLAEKGFPLSDRLYALLSTDRFLAADPNAGPYFYLPSGEPKPVGTLLVNPALADTLRQIAEHGADAFYTGPIAEDIIKTVQNARNSRGRMTLKDLAQYQSKPRSALCRPYRTWRVCTMPPPTSGGVTTLQILGHLEAFDSARVGADTPDAIHLYAESSRLAYADRGLYLADPDFVSVPVDALLNRDYLRSRSKHIDPAKSMGKAKAGQLGSVHRNRSPDQSLELPSTTHVVAADDSGRVVSMTASIEQAFGAHLMVRGFLLNNELTDFSFVPEKNGRPIANRIQGGKRPRSSMSPTLVFKNDTGAFHLAIGSPGGSRIIGYVTRALIGILDGGLDVQAALSRPNVVNRNGRTEIEVFPGYEEWVGRIQAQLEALGHKVKTRSLNSGLHAILRNGEGWTGGADPRREGVALGD